MNYNFALKRKVTRKVMIEEIGINANDRWGCLRIKGEQMTEIVKKGQIYDQIKIKNH